jgi:putative DNA methylase
MPTKLIEVALPLDVINKEAAREKSIRQGHPSTLHLWWARRPLAACRAVLFAQLVDDPSAHPDEFPSAEAQDVERQRLFRVIERLVPWEASNNEVILEEARAEIRKCYPDGVPPIIDPFCGGGSIPLEAQRLGLEARASDLNPVAVLITKALIELPPKFAGRPPVHPAESGTLGTFDRDWKGAAGLADDVHWYGNWMRERAEERIGHLYPKATLPGGTTATVIAWLWARTVLCPNPACGSIMPLVRSFWLGKKTGREAWVRPIPDSERKRVRFEIGHGKQGPPMDGTKTGRGSNFKCLVCDQPASEEYLRREGSAGRIGAQLMAVVAGGDRQRVYLPPDASHEVSANVKRPDDVPESEMPNNPRWFSPPAYGMTQHADLFTNRQLIALCTFSDLVGEATAKVLEDSGGDLPYSEAVGEYLALATSRLTDMNNSLVTWSNSRDQTRNLFARQAVPMAWDYAEVNPFGGAAGDLGVSLTSAVKVIKGLPAVGSGHARQAEAAKLNEPNAVLSTDPPYYDNIGYADLSDVFYVWLRRALRTIDPDLFGTMLTPKSAELVATPYRFNGSRQLAEKHFETGFAEAFARAGTESLAGTPMTVFYAFKQSEEDSDDGEFLTSRVASTGWEKMLEGLLKAGLSVTGTWPMHTERGVRSVGIGTNALASSIVLVCRPRPETAGVTDRRGFQHALRIRLATALRDLQSGGVAPVDLAQASIGPGMAVFSSYAKVVEPNGGAMSVRTALSLINQVLDEVAAEQEGEFDEDTRWAVAWYSEYGMDDGPFGRADDLSRAKNVSVEGLVRSGIVKSGAGKVRLLDRSELDPNWDPAKDERLTIWEVTQQLIRRLLDESEGSAADLLSRVGGLGEPARDLAYRLFQIAESKKWAKEAGPYNALAAAWPELSRRAALGQNVQETLI